MIAVFSEQDDEADEQRPLSAGGDNSICHCDAR